MKSIKELPEKTAVYLVLTIIFFFNLPILLSAQDADEGRQDEKKRENIRHRKFAPGRLIVKYRKGAGLQKVGGLKSRKRLRTKRVLSRRKRIELVEVPKGKSVGDTLQGLKNDPDVEYAEPDYLIKLKAVPNDPKFNETNKLWGLHNEGTSSLPADVDIDAPEGWDIRHSAPNTIVAIIDTGIDVDHEDLAANMWRNPGETLNGIDDDGNGYIDDIYGINAISGTLPKKAGNPEDDNGHGSHCAGTIGGVGNNGIGVAGVCWNVQLMGLKFLDSSGSGFTSDAIECFEYAIAEGANVISCSWGGGGYSQALYDILNECRNNGIIVVCAAGNNGTNNDIIPNYPSNYALDNIVAVGAADTYGKEANFSSTGYGTVDVFAPGYNIFSCYKHNRYTTISGTSMATPHVAGILALMREQYQSDDFLQVINRLYNSVVPYKLNECKTKGMVNLFNALSDPSNKPINDNLVDWVTLRSDLKTSMDCTNVGATKELNEPNHAGNAGGHSVWAYWRAPISGKVVMTTEESNFDTLLGVYTGSSISRLNLVAENDNISSSKLQSKVEFSAVAKTKYRIAVDGKNGDQGAVALRISCPPPNDDFADRQNLGSGLLYENVTGDNVGASREDGEPAHAGQTTGNSIWYSWTPASTRLCRISLEGSSYDTVMAVYTGDSIDNLQLVVANDDKVLYSITYSEVEFVAQAGVEYSIAVDGWGNFVGQSNLTLDASADQPPRAKFEVYPQDSKPLAVTLDASRSSDLENDIVEYLWTFADGNTDVGKTINRNFAYYGHHQVQLTVTDDQGLTDTESKVIVINAQGIVPTDIQCYFNFDEGVGDITKDASQNGYDGTLAAKQDQPLAEWITGTSGNALRFNSNNYVKTPAFVWDEDTDYPTAASLSVWFSASANVPSGSERYIIGRGKEGFALSQLQDTLSLSCPLYDTQTFSTSIEKINITMPPLNEWHHAVAILDTEVGNGMKLYIDGELVAEKDIQGLKLPIPKAGVFIGLGGPRTAQYCFEGDIDEVGLYAKALNQAEIDYLFGNGEVVTYPPDAPPVTQDDPDITAPNVPQNLTATTISDSQINLSWNASTDPVVPGQINSGVASYEIRRNGAKIGNSTNTSYSDSGLAADTSYSYTVAAIDGAGNASAESAAANATTSGTGIDLPTVSFKGGDPLASEPNAEAGKGKGKFRLYRTGDISSELLVNYTISGTAVNGSDYEALSGNVTFPAEKAYTTVAVKILTDAQDEDDETVIMTLTDSSTYIVDQEKSTSTVTIIDAEYGSPTVSAKVLDGEASEPDAVDSKGSAKFLVYRTGSLGVPLEVKYTLTGTATNGEDYVLCEGTMTINVDRDKAVLKIRVLDDDLTEGTENVQMNIAVDPAYQIDPELSSATITIADAD